MDISVVIVNWNGRPYLNETLEALRRQTLPAKRIIVVDNGSRDGSETDLAALDWPELTCVMLPENTGFAAGNNAAWQYLEGEAVALLNNDAVPAENWLQVMAAVLKSDTKAGMVACKILRYHTPEIIDKCGHLIYGDGLNRGWGTGQRDQKPFLTRQEVLWPDGCAALFRKSALNEVGFFDEDFFCYGEDADLGFRLRWAGYGCVFEPEAKVYHHHSASLGKFSPYKAYLIERNRWWVLVKNFPIRMVLLSPLLTLQRYAYNAFSLVSRRGSAAGFKSEHGSLVLVKALIRANVDGLKGIPRQWRKRRRIMRRISDAEMMALLTKFKISAQALTLED